MEPGSSQRCRRNRMRANRHKLENEKFQSDIRKTFLPRSVETLQQMSTLATIPPSLEVSKIQLDIEFSNLISLDLLWGGLGISRGLPNFIILWLLDSVLSRTRFFFLHDSVSEVNSWLHWNRITKFLLTSWYSEFCMVWRVLWNQIILFVLEELQRKAFGFFLKVYFTINRFL